MNKNNWQAEFWLGGRSARQAQFVETETEPESETESEAEAETETDPPAEVFMAQARWIMARQDGQVGWSCRCE